jgi:hypothetical protein
MATTKEPHERVPEDLQEIMRALQDVNANRPSRQSDQIVRSCAPALIFVARHEPDLFPKPFARAIAHALNPVRLWNVACGIDGLNVQGIDVTRIIDDNFLWENLNIIDHDSESYLWESLNARTPNATDLFIAPQVFILILDAYEEQLKQLRKLKEPRWGIA